MTFTHRAGGGFLPSSGGGPDKVPLFRKLIAGRGIAPLGDLTVDRVVELDPTVHVGEVTDDWTPTWTGITVGNGTTFASYRRVGDVVFYKIRFDLGSSSAVTGAVSATAPIAGTTVTSAFGTALFQDATSATDPLGFCFVGATDVIVFRTDTNASLSSTVPFTWATGDIIEGTGFYFLTD